MKENELPSGPVEALLGLLTSALDQAPGVHTGADFFAEFEDPFSPDMTAVRGGELSSIDPADDPIATEPLFLPLVSFLRDCLSNKVPVRIIDGEFKRAAGGWDHVMVAETWDEYLKFRGEMREQEDAIVECALRFGTSPRRVSRYRAPPEPDKLVVGLRTTREIREAPAELKAALDALERRLAAQGRLLQSVTFTIEGDSADPQVECEYDYRLAKDGK